MAQLVVVDGPGKMDAQCVPIPTDTGALKPGIVYLTGTITPNEN